MKKLDTVRQGDVLLVYLGDEEVQGVHEANQNDKSRVILAYGEVTGHAHAVYGGGAKLFHFDPDKGYQGVVADAVLKVEQPTALKHEEHAPIGLPVGTYLVVRQVEYTPEELRRVAD